MDDYSKAILTIIAFLLGTIAYKLWQPPGAPMNPLDNLITLESFRTIEGLPQNEKNEEIRKLFAKIPLVQVHGLTQVYGTVDIGNTVEVYGR